MATGLPGLRNPAVSSIMPFMVNEITQKYELAPEVFYFNENGIMKPSAYQAFFAQLAELHLAIVNSGADETMKYGLAWALISMSIEIERPVKTGEKLKASTWYSGKKGPYYRRELLFFDDEDNIVFKGSTYSVLLDVESRKVYRKNEVPFFMTDPNETFCVEANHRFKEDHDFIKVEEMKVRPSDLDLLGHVNNRRYGDFAYDSLSGEERLNLDKLKRLDFFFISEMRNGDLYTMLKATEDNKIIIKGDNNTKGDTAFYLNLQF